IEDSEAHSAATGSRPCSWSSVSWRRMTAVSTPRRRWLGATLTQVTPAQGTTPPGTVSSRLWTPAVATSRSPSHSPSERSSSACAGTASTKAAGGSSANAVNRARLNAGHSSGVAGRSRSAKSVTGAVYREPGTPCDRSSSLGRRTSAAPAVRVPGATSVRPASRTTTSIAATSSGRPPSTTTRPCGMPKAASAACTACAAALCRDIDTLVLTRMRTSGPSASTVVTSRSAAQVGQGRHHPAVLVLVLGEAQLGEDPLGVLLDGTLGHHQPPGDRTVRGALGDEPEDLALPRGQPAHRVVGATAGEQLGDHLRVEHGPPG